MTRTAALLLAAAALAACVTPGATVSASHYAQCVNALDDEANARQECQIQRDLCNITLKAKTPDLTAHVAPMPIVEDSACFADCITAVPATRKVNAVDMDTCLDNCKRGTAP